MPNKQVKTVKKLKLKKPKLYSVILLNDDYTTMDFVVFVLTSIFARTSDQAVEVMLAIHNHGKGIANSYPYEIAVEKMNETKSVARENDFPLDCIIEEK